MSSGPDPWWSADVGDYIRDRGIAHMKAAHGCGTIEITSSRHVQ